MAACNSDLKLLMGTFHIVPQVLTGIVMLICDGIVLRHRCKTKVIAPIAGEARLLTSSTVLDKRSEKAACMSHDEHQF